MLERRGLYLSHPGMSLHPNFKVLGRLPYFLITKMTSRRLCSEANSTSLPMGFLYTEKITSYNWSVRPQILAQSKQVQHHWIDMIKGFPLVSNLVLWGFSKRGQRSGSGPYTHPNIRGKLPAMLLNNSGTKNARETRFVPESCWHVTASEFQSFRAASILLDNENDKQAAVLRS